MRNSQVITAFINSKEAKTQHLRTDGTKLINYNTVIAKKEGDKVVVSSTKYSQTTSTIQNMVIREVPASKLERREMGW
jgi:hypothetical protein